MTAITLPPRLGDARRDILRALLRQTGWAGKPVKLLSLAELTSALEAQGITQHDVDAALDPDMLEVTKANLDRTLANLPAETAETEAETVPDETASSAGSCASEASASLQLEAETIRRQVGGALLDGDPARADAVIASVIERARAATTEAEALRSALAQTPSVISTGPSGAPIIVPRIVGKKTAGELLRLPNAPFASWPLALYAGGVNVPPVDDKYRFDEEATHIALACFRANAQTQGATAPGYVMFAGPAGVGKSSWAEQFAAVTGRPFVSISFSVGLEPADLVGSPDPTTIGGMGWKDGVFTRAIRVPGTVILLDEIGAAHEATALAFNAALQRRALVIPETGEEVPFAPGVTIVGANNDLLTLTAAGRQQYTGLRRQNAAFADRFSVQIWVGYPAATAEVGMLIDHVPGTPRALARLLVEAAGNTRAKVKSDDLTSGIGFRRLVAWTRLLCAGVPAAAAFASAVLHYAPESDHETLREIAAAMGVCDESVIASARMNKRATPVDPTRPGGEFSVIEDDETENG